MFFFELRFAYSFLILFSGSSVAFLRFYNLDELRRYCIHCNWSGSCIKILATHSLLVSFTEKSYQFLII